MPRSKAQFEEMRRATKAKIQRAGIELFARKGFAATSVQDIADWAGISTGLLYRHYQSKEELYRELVVQAAQGLREIAHRLQTDTSPARLIEQLTQEVLADLTRDDEFAQFMVVVTQSLLVEESFPEVQLLVAANQLLLEQMAHLIEKGQRLGQFERGDPQQMTHYYFAVIQGLAMMKFAMRDRFVAPTPNIVHAFLLKEETDEAR